MIHKIIVYFFNYSFFYHFTRTINKSLIITLINAVSNKKTVLIKGFLFAWRIIQIYTFTKTKKAKIIVEVVALLYNIYKREKNR